MRKELINLGRQDGNSKRRKGRQEKRGTAGRTKMRGRRTDKFESKKTKG